MSKMEDYTYDLPADLEDVTGQVPQGTGYVPIGSQIGDNRSWRERDWVWWPASTNVMGARYCADNSFRMQVKYARKTTSKRSGTVVTETVPRTYEYGPDYRVTWDLWFNFLHAWSKGHFSWANLDPRWSNSIPYRKIQ